MTTTWHIIQQASGEILDTIDVKDGEVLTVGPEAARWGLAAISEAGMLTYQPLAHM